MSRATGPWSLSRIGLALLAVTAIGLFAVTLWVEREAEYSLDTLETEGQERALILYHPSRDAGFSDDLSAALAEGLADAGMSVDRATMARATPSDQRDYTLVAIVSNTYFWTPDLPTLRYLRRARIDGVPAIGVMAGAGSTARASRMLEDALERTGAEVLGVRSFWLLRPNDERRMDEPNRAVALDRVRRFGAEVATGLARGGV